jgi:hypothetical protein
MKTIILDGKETDIQTLIDGRHRIKIINGWMVPIWPVTEHGRQDRFQYIDNTGYTGEADYSYEEYETYQKQPEPLKPSERIKKEVSEKFKNNNMSRCDAHYYAILEYLDEQFESQNKQKKEG